MPVSISRHLRKRGKKYRASVALVPPALQPLEGAVALLLQVSPSAFDATAELHVRLCTDTTQSDQNVRATVRLPHGTGKEIRIAAFVTEDEVGAAKSAGAALVGGKDLIEEIAKGKLEFDIAVAMPAMMKELGKVAKILGTKGLMPSPKSGTVSDDPAALIEELKAGRVEFRSDKQGIIHTVFGKLSFGKEKLQENLEVLLQAIREAKPSTVKGEYIGSVFVCSTMGPSIQVQLK